MSLCPRHATVHALLRAALGNAHHGHRTARRTMTAISKQCRKLPQGEPMGRAFTDGEMETLKRMSDWMNVHAETLRSFAEEAGVVRHCGYQLGHPGPCQEDE